MPHDHEGDIPYPLPGKSETTEQYPDFVVDTTGQQLAAKAIMSWAEVAHIIDESEFSHEINENNSPELSREERWRQRVNATADFMREYAGYWFTTKDLHTHLFKLFQAEDWRVMQTLERLANHPEHGPHFREDEIKPGAIRRFWYSENISNFEMPGLAFADKEVRFPDDDLVQDNDERDQDNTDIELTPVSERKKLVWKVVFNEDGTGSLATSTTRYALALRIVDSLANANSGMSTDTLMARLAEHDLNPSERELDGALQYIKGWLPKEYSARWRDEITEDRDGKPIRRLRIDRNRRK